MNQMTMKEFRAALRVAKDVFIWSLIYGPNFDGEYVRVSKAALRQAIRSDAEEMDADIRNGDLYVN